MSMWVATWMIGLVCRKIVGWVVYQMDEWVETLNKRQVGNRDVGAAGFSAASSASASAYKM